MKKHRNVIIISFAVLFIIIISGTVCYATGPDQGMFPDVKSLFNGQSKSKYLSTYRDNYYLDMKETGVFKSFDFNIFNGFANMLFQAQKSLTYVIMIIVYYAFELKFTDLMDPVLTGVINALRDSIFNQFAIMFIALLGIFYVTKIIRDQKTQVWMAILQTIAIVSISTFFLATPTKFLNAIDNLSEGVSKSVLEGTFKATHKGEAPDTAVITVCEDLWVMFVHKPWQILEFGSTKAAEEQEENILTKKPDAKERQEYVNNLAKDGDLFSPVWGLGRLSAIVIYIIPLLIQMALIGILCLLVLMYKALMITTAMFGPFVFLLALIPWFGFRALNSWISKLVGYGSMKIVLSFFVTILFAFTIAIYSYADKLGWMFVLLTQVTVTYGIYWKRDKFFDFIVIARDSIQKGHAPLNRELRKDANVEGYLKNLRFRKQKNEGEDDDDDAKSLGRGKYSTGSRKKETKSDKEEGDLENSGKGKHYNQEGSKKANSQSLKGLLKVAEDILEQQYENSKRMSEEKAKATGKEPDYDYSVRKVMNREEMNLPKFEEREKLALAKQLERVAKAGGDPEELYKEKIKLESPEEDVERPKGIVIKHDGEEEIINPDELKEELSLPERSKKSTEDFNRVYGKNYDPRFMEKLMKRYGSSNVENTLKNMEKVSNRENIRNPAGYLTESLKNNELNREDLKPEYEEAYRPEKINIDNVENEHNGNNNEKIKFPSHEPAVNKHSSKNVNWEKERVSHESVNTPNMKQNYLDEDTIRPNDEAVIKEEPVSLNIDDQAKTVEKPPTVRVNRNENVKIDKKEVANENKFKSGVNIEKEFVPAKEVENIEPEKLKLGEDNNEQEI